MKIELHEKVYAKFGWNLPDPFLVVNKSSSELEKRQENDNS
jgi:hypothetical protein